MKRVRFVGSLAGRGENGRAFCREFRPSSRKNGLQNLLTATRITVTGSSNPETVPAIPGVYANQLPPAGGGRLSESSNGKTLLGLAAKKIRERLLRRLFFL